jgi:deoxyribose-phosphate aldolase
MTLPGQISGPKELARFVDYLLLHPHVTKDEVARVCASARELGLGGICVHTSRLAQACHLLEDSGVKIIAAIDFPLGAADSDAKRYEAEVAVDNDAHFIEAVANIGRIKDADHGYVSREFRDLVEAADERPVSVVVEAPLLTRAEIETVCHLAIEAGCKGITTSTGIDGRVARAEDVRLTKDIVGEKFGVKAVGGIIDGAAALAMLEAGATRIGLSGVKEILESLEPQGR